jgi:hypothetical protein
MPETTRKRQDVQLVFQGGGAKLSALLAAAAAVQEAQTRGLVNLTRVCGTSAGAIAAAILATGLPVSDFRNRLRDRGDRYLKWINADVGKVGIGWALARGQPFLSEAGFRKVLWDLFDHDTGRIESFDQLKIPLTVVAADIRNGRRVSYSRTSGDRPLIDALVDSAALPLVFRGGAGDHHIVRWPVREPAGPGDGRRTHERQGHRDLVRAHGGSRDPIEYGWVDHLSLTSSRGDVDVVDLVIELPIACRQLQLARMPDGPPGRMMTPLELDRYGPPETGFHLKGWRGEGLKRDQRFGVLLTMQAS